MTTVALTLSGKMETLCTLHSGVILRYLAVLHFGDCAKKRDRNNCLPYSNYSMQSALLFYRDLATTCTFPRDKSHK